jgi:hypothetical protein
MRTLGLICAASFALWFAAALPAGELSESPIADTVEANLAPPAPLMVTNVEASATLEQEEPLKAPVIFVHHPEVADEVEQDFHAAFSTVRSNFFEVMSVVYKRNEVIPQRFNSSRFKALFAAFKRRHADFPQLTNLIGLWSVGNSDEAVQKALSACLREAMQQTIRPDALPLEIKPGSQLWLVTMPHSDEALTLEIAKRHAALLPDTNLVTLSHARSEFQRLAPSDQRAQAHYLASFLKPNCILELELTSQSRRRVDVPSPADHYEAGHSISPPGQKVDTTIMGDSKPLPTVAGEPPQPVNGSPEKGVWRPRLNPWWWTGLALVVAGLSVGSWSWLNRRKPVSILPARVAGNGAPAGIITCPSCNENIVLSAETLENLSTNTRTWQQRALAAEQCAERAHAAIRAGVLPHLADGLKQKFIQGLVSERSQMLDAQKSATTELGELERRLEDLHAPLQERLHTYEKRIAELEKLLAAKGEENRKLLQAEIKETRRKDTAVTENQIHAKPAGV